MAVVYADDPVDFIDGELPQGTVIEATRGRFVVSDGFEAYTLSGFGFTYSGPFLTGGVVTGFAWHYGNNLALEILDFDADAETVDFYAADGDLFGLLSYVLEFDDEIYGSDFADRLAGFDGDDFFDPGRGFDDVYGGSGIDTVFLAGSVFDYEIVSIGQNAYRVSDLNLANGDEGIDRFFDVEFVEFSSGATYFLPDLANSALWFELPRDVEVVAATYQFFTGRVPTANGFEYLIASPANPSDLNDPYYDQFNTENRYLNFASNLGTIGEGAAFFDAVFGGLSFEATVRTAYREVMGEPLTGAALAFFLNAETYYRTVAGDRVVRPGVDLFEATKIVAIGSILNEAVKSGDGPYAEAIDALVADVAPDGVSIYLGQDLFDVA